MQCPTEISIEMAIMSNPGHFLARATEMLCSDKFYPAIDSAFRLTLGPAPIALDEFGVRLADYFRCSESCFVTAASYLARVKHTHPQLFDEASSHKLMLAALIVACKFVDDEHYRQAHYARCGGIEVAELNLLESQFLCLLGFNATVNPNDYQAAMCMMAAAVCPPEVKFAPGTMLRSRSGLKIPVGRQSF